MNCTRELLLTPVAGYRERIDEHRDYTRASVAGICIPHNHCHRSSHFQPRFAQLNRALVVYARNSTHGAALFFAFGCGVQADQITRAQFEHTYKHI